LPLALSLAVRAGARLQLLLVQNTREAEEEQPSPTSASKAREGFAVPEAYLKGITRKLRADGAPGADPLVASGKVAETILNQVVDRKVDLVVMTTHARGTVGRLCLGSVADQLLRELPKPLLLVRPVPAHAQLSAKVTLRHLLVPLDGTVLAGQILAPAIALGELMDATYTLLRVVQPVAPVHYPPEGVVADPGPEGLREQVDRVETEARRNAEEYLDEVAQRLRRHLLQMRTKIVDETRPAIAVIEDAQRLSADLIAMQTHGRGGLARLAVGSVADKVLRGSAMPLLVQRPAPSA
jgi:nucleotide-binding universal stress UspA family protein